MLIEGGEQIYAIGIKEALGFASGLVLLMLAGFGGLLRYFIQGKLADLSAGMKDLQSEVKATNDRLQDDVAEMKKEAFEFRIYAEREFVKKPDYNDAILRLHARIDEVLVAVKAGNRTTGN